MLLGYCAQDRDGNVWYFGEDVQELDANGHVVSTGGSWRAGDDKALPRKVNVPYGAFADAPATKEWRPVEPEVDFRCPTSGESGTEPQ